jgi:hypothetical protein
MHRVKSAGVADLVSPASPAMAVATTCDGMPGANFHTAPPDVGRGVGASPLPAPAAVCYDGPA